MEERFGEQVYVPLAEAAFSDALKRAGVESADVGHLAVAGLHARVVKAIVASLGVPSSALVPDRNQVVGNLGAAQVGLGLADALEWAEPGDLIAAVIVADGVSVLLLPRQRCRFLPSVPGAARSGSHPLPSSSTRNAVSLPTRGS